MRAGKTGEGEVRTMDGWIAVRLSMIQDRQTEARRGIARERGARPADPRPVARVGRSQDGIALRPTAQPTRG
jgi:hypothetical protein